MSSMAEHVASGEVQQSYLGPSWQASAPCAHILLQVVCAAVEVCLHAVLRDGDGIMSWHYMQLVPAPLPQAFVPAPACSLSSACSLMLEPVAMHAWQAPVGSAQHGLGNQGDVGAGDLSDVDPDLLSELSLEALERHWASDPRWEAASESQRKTLYAEVLGVPVAAAAERKQVRMPLRE
jgi:hypothetical protein